MGRPRHGIINHREREAVVYYVAGWLKCDIADKMGITTWGAEIHRERAYRKLGAHDKLSALRKLFEHKLLTHEE